VEPTVEVVEATASVAGSDSDDYRGDVYLKLAIATRRVGAEK
jgi:hypothetical protein